MNKPSDADMAEIRAFIGSVKWQFAKTMVFCPHYYNVLAWNPEKSDGFFKLVNAIFNHGYKQEWPTPEEMKSFGDRQITKRIVTYFNVDDYKYWVMDDTIEDTTLINRDKIS